jgi:uncharacterized protein YndB with AHSA1/START domain
VTGRTAGGASSRSRRRARWSEDGFGDEPGNAGGMPMTRMSVHLTERPDGGTRMTIESTFPSREAMEQLISMGMDQGMQEALGQIEAVLAGT